MIEQLCAGCIHEHMIAIRVTTVGCQVSDLLFLPFLQCSLRTILLLQRNRFKRSPGRKKLPAALEEVYIIIEVKLGQHSKKLVGL